MNSKSNLRRVNAVVLDIAAGVVRPCGVVDIAAGVGDITADISAEDLGDVSGLDITI
jgi:hypothetical protein